MSDISTVVVTKNLLLGRGCHNCRNCIRISSIGTNTRLYERHACNRRNSLPVIKTCHNWE